MPQRGSRVSEGRRWPQGWLADATRTVVFHVEQWSGSICALAFGAARRRVHAPEEGRRRTALRVFHVERRRTVWLLYGGVYLVLR